MSIVPMDSYLFVTTPESAVEGMESITGTVIANPTPENDLIVHLTSNNLSRLSVQSEITIKAGKESASFSMSIIDEQLLNGSSNIQVLASVSNYYTGSANLNIDDNDPAILNLMLPDKVMNGYKMQGKISINRPLDLDTKIPLILSTTDINIYPETVVMPAGLSEITFDLTMTGVPQTISMTPSVANWTVNCETII